MQLFFFLHLGVTSHSAQGLLLAVLGKHMGCQRWNLGWPCAWQTPYCTGPISLFSRAHWNTMIGWQIYYASQTYLTLFLAIIFKSCKEKILNIATLSVGSERAKLFKRSAELSGTELKMSKLRIPTVHSTKFKSLTFIFCSLLENQS